MLGVLKIILIIYFIIINIFTFFVRGKDKSLARKQKRRISEKTLLNYVWLGGSFGALIGSSFFHHKTIKGSFLWKMYLICLVWIVIAILVLYYL